MADSRTLKAAVLSLANASSALLSLALVMVLSRLFTKHDYATFRQSQLVVNIALPILGLGLANAILYFIPRDPQSSRTVVLNAVRLSLIAGAIFAVFSVFVAPHWLSRQFNNPDLRSTLPWASLLAAGMLLHQLLPPTLVALGRTRLVPVSVILARSLIFVATITAVLVHRTPLSGFIALGVTAFVVGAVSLIPMLRFTTGQLTAAASGHSRELLKYAVPLAAAGLLEGLAMKVDSTLVAAMCTPEQFAVFVNGAMEIPFISIISGSVAAVILPDMIGLIKQNDPAGAHALWKRAALKCAFLLLPIGGLLFVTAPSLMTALYSRQYVDSAVPFRLYLFLLPARIAVFGALFQAAGRTDIIFRRSIGTLVLNVLVSYPLVRLYGISGAAIGTLVVFWAYVIPYCLYHTRIVLIEGHEEILPYKSIGIVMACIAVSVGVGVGVNHHWLLAGFGGALAYAVCLAVLAYCFLRPLFTQCFSIRLPGFRKGREAPQL